MMRVTGDIIYVPDPYLGSTLAPKSSCYIERQVTREHVYTNDRGWRVGEDGLAADACDVALIGCSWPMGVGVEHEDSFAHQIEVNTEFSVANLGVGSYSLLQATRRLEKNIALIKPKKVVLAYGHWLTNRCFKLNAMSDVVLRPIYKRTSAGEVKIQEPSNPSHEVFCKFMGLHRELNAGKTTLIKSLFFKILSKVLFLKTRRFGLNKISRLRYVEGPHEADYFSLRQDVLKYEAEKLLALCVENNVLLCVAHMHQYTVKNSHDVRAIQDDREFWEGFAAKHAAVSYQPPTDMEAAIDAHMASIGDSESLLEAIHCPDNNHPNAVGHGLIAGVIAKFIQVP